MGSCQSLSPEPSTPSTPTAGKGKKRRKDKRKGRKKVGRSHASQSSGSERGGRRGRHGQTDNTRGTVEDDDLKSTLRTLETETDSSAEEEYAEQNKSRQVEGLVPNLATVGVDGNMDTLEDPVKAVERELRRCGEDVEKARREVVGDDRTDMLGKKEVEGGDPMGEWGQVDEKRCKEEKKEKGETTTRLDDIDVSVIEEEGGCLEGNEEDVGMEKERYEKVGGEDDKGDAGNDDENDSQDYEGSRRVRLDTEEEEERSQDLDSEVRRSLSRRMSH